MEAKREHQSFHVGLKAFIANGEKLLILQDRDGLWELPGGRIEKGEILDGIEKSFRREVAEELGNDFQYNVGRVFHAWIRKPDPTQLPSNAAYRGKDLCIFLVGILCEYKGGEPRLSREHKNFRWITKEETNTLAFENTYKEAVEKYFEIR